MEMVHTPNRVPLQVYSPFLKLPGFIYARLEMSGHHESQSAMMNMVQVVGHRIRKQAYI